MITTAEIQKSSRTQRIAYKSIMGATLTDINL